jgi:alanyl-tRNA synthetase
VTVSDDLIEQGLDAGELVRDAVSEAGGKGGGKAGMAQGKVPEPSGLQTALERLRERLEG